MPNPTDQLQDAALIERVRSGDSDAFGIIVSRHWDRIFSRALHLLKNREDAEEVAQDTFIRAQRGLDNFRGDAALSTWLYQIATNLSHNRYWYWWRRKRDASLSLEQTFGPDGEVTLENLLPAEGPSPGEEALTTEFMEQVGKGMEKLSKKHREVLTLRNIHNLSYEEIAEELKISVGTVKSRIARARERLREQMGSDFQ
ncbi:MAG: RNA polymerase sigma factor [Opitutales bacterium]